MNPELVSTDLKEFLPWFTEATKKDLVVRLNKLTARGDTYSLVQIEAFATSHEGHLRHMIYQCWEPMGANAGPMLKSVGFTDGEAVKQGRLQRDFEYWPVSCPAFLVKSNVVLCSDYKPCAQENEMSSLNPHYALAFASLLERYHSTSLSFVKETCRCLLARWNVGNIQTKGLVHW